MEQMRDFWIHVGEMPKVSFRNLFFNKTIFNLRFIVHQIPKKQLDFHKICNSSIEFYVGATRLLDFQPQYFFNHTQKADDFFSILMASNLIPILYHWPIKIGKFYYIDGGFADNIPYEVAFSAGCSRVFIIVPNENGLLLKKVFQTYGHCIPLKYKHRISIISPLHPLHPVCAKKSQIEEAMEEGYKAGKKVLV
jgi:predicted acylesterase/phospholipase RssA